MTDSSDTMSVDLKVPKGPTPWKAFKKGAVKRLHKLRGAGNHRGSVTYLNNSEGGEFSTDDGGSVGSADIVVTPRPCDGSGINTSHRQDSAAADTSIGSSFRTASSIDETQSDIITLNCSPCARRKTFSSSKGVSLLTTSRDSSDTVDSEIMDKKHSSSLKDLPVSAYRLEITIISGSGLIAKDRNGFSDPYVKVRYRGKNLHRTRVIDRNLNPTWNETFSVPINDLHEPVFLRVYDHDTFSGDDFMGFSSVTPVDMNADKPTNQVLELRAEKYSQNALLGQLHIRCSLLTQNHDIVNPSLAPVDSGKSIMGMLRQDTNSSSWDYTVRIVLIEGRNLLAMDDNGFSDPYVRFKLQSEKYKSKVKNKTLNPNWMEVFSMHLYDRKSWMLDLNVFDYNLAGRADFIGRSAIDLSELKKDQTHDMTLNLEDQTGTIRLLVTITGAVSSAEHEISHTERREVIRKYGLTRSVTSMKDVGWLQVKVIRAHGLASMDWGGSSDPFCTVELVNTMLQTHTSYKTLNPEWDRVFTLPVYDIHSILIITVFDEDKDMKKEFIGKVSIPLMMIENGVEKWYGLKNKKLLSRAKGEILVELDLEYNHFKAAIRTLNPREEMILKEEPKFKLGVFKRNVGRIRTVASSIGNAKNFWQSLIDWHTPWKSLLAFAMLLIAVWNFELYMLPLTLILLLVWNYLVMQIKGGPADDMVQFESADSTEDDEEDTEDGKEEGKRSIAETYAAVMTVCCKIQEILGLISDHLESVKNTFNWTIPWLSMLAIVILGIIMYILYLVPLRYLILLWGINKFTKRLRKPNYIPNNELLDFLSRVPSDIEKVMYKEIRPDLSNIKKKTSGRSSPQGVRQRKK